MKKFSILLRSGQNARVSQKQRSKRIRRRVIATGWECPVLAPCISPDYTRPYGCSVKYQGAE
jgi:hypothetical protein